MDESATSATSVYELRPFYRSVAYATYPNIVKIGFIVTFKMTLKTTLQVSPLEWRENGKK